MLNLRLGNGEPRGRLHKPQTVLRKSALCGRSTVADRVASRSVFMLWGTFVCYAVGGFWKPVSQLEKTTGIALVFDVGSFCLALLILIDAVWHWSPLWQRLARKSEVRRCAALLIAAVGLALITGLVNFVVGESDINDVKRYVWEAVPISLVGIIVIGAAIRGQERRFAAMMLSQSALAACYTIAVLARYPVSGDRSMFGGPHYVAYGMISVTVFPLGMLEVYNGAQRAVAIASYVVFCAFNLIYQSRGGSIITLFIIPATVVIGKLMTHTRAPVSRKAKSNVKTMIAGIVFAFGLIMIGSLSPTLRRQVDTGIKKTETRLYGGVASQSLTEGFVYNTEGEYDDSRGAEAKDYLAQLSGKQLLIGQGVGGGWMSNFWQTEWYMVHFGPLHLVLKGGVLLCLAYLCAIGLAVKRTLFCKNPCSLTFSAGVFVVYIFANFLKHGPIEFSYETVMFWIALGICFAGKAQQSESTCKIDRPKTKQLVVNISP